MGFLIKLEAAVEKAKPLAGKHRAKPDVSSENGAQAKHLSETTRLMSSRPVAKLLGSLRLKPLGAQDLSSLLVKLGPVAIAALLVDVKVLAKKDQIKLERQLARLLSSKR